MDVGGRVEGQECAVRTQVADEGRLDVHQKLVH